MGSTFNPQILVEKLAKLNNSQQSIETLSHWCIFHMNKANLIVETWERQFHCSPREQRLAFLYLANDILQNSRRKGSEFVGEFWRVLPDALRDVINSGDEFGRNSALRLISIWDDRKVFGSRGQMLKERFVRQSQDNSNRNEKHPGIKLKQSAGSALEKIVADCDGVFGGDLDEDALLNKSRDAIDSIEKISREVTADVNSGKLNESGVVEEVQKHQAVLRYCIEQFNAIETLRTTILSHLSEATQEQEHKLDQVRHQRQAAESLAEKADNLCRQFPNGNNIQMVLEQGLSETHTSAAPNAFMTRDEEQSGPVMYTPHAHFPENSGHGEENHLKSAAAAVAAKLTASTSSAQMLSFVLSSLASEGVIGNAVSESAGDYHSEKRPKLVENNDQPYIPPSHSSSPQPPLPPFQQSDSDHQNGGTTAQQLGSNEQPPPPPHPPLPPYSMPQFLQNAGSMTSEPYTYGTTLLQPPLVPGYSTSGNSGMGIPPFTATPNNNSSYQNFQGPDGGFYNHPSSLPMAPQ